MSSDIDLHGLYLEFADAQRGVGQLARAADAYALALYYAKRVGDVPRVRRCREQIAVCNPDHIVCRESSAPLFFAQLLLRYPPEEIAERLEAMKSGVWLTDSDPLAETPEVSSSDPFSVPRDTFVDPMAYARFEAADGIFETDYSGRSRGIPAPAPAPQVPAGSAGTATPASHPASESLSEAPFSRPEAHSWLEPALPASTAPAADRHHLYVPGTESRMEASDFRMPRGFTTAVQPTEDYQFADGTGAARANSIRPSLFAAGLRVTSVLTLLLGIASVGFFASQVYPTLTRAGIDLEAMLSRATGVLPTSGAEETAGTQGGNGADSAVPSAPGWRPADSTRLGSRHEKWSDGTQR